MKLSISITNNAPDAVFEALSSPEFARCFLREVAEDALHEEYPFSPRHCVELPTQCIAITDETRVHVTLSTYGGLIPSTYHNAVDVVAETVRKHVADELAGEAEVRIYVDLFVHRNHTEGWTTATGEAVAKAEALAA